MIGVRNTDGRAEEAAETSAGRALVKKKARRWEAAAAYGRGGVERQIIWR